MAPNQVSQLVGERISNLKGLFNFKSPKYRVLNEPDIKDISYIPITF